VPLEREFHRLKSIRVGRDPEEDKIGPEPCQGEPSRGTLSLEVQNQEALNLLQKVKLRMLVAEVEEAKGEAEEVVEAVVEEVGMGKI
jgi:hypothetical protein